MRAQGFLEVRIGGERFGLPLSQVEHVADLGEVLSVPSRVRAMRGVTSLRGRLVPLLHLGALLSGSEPPARRGRTLVVARVGERRVALEVDEADAVRREAIVAPPESRAAPWARGVVRRDDGLVPILDLSGLGEPLLVGGVGES
jgi:chemotaxis signal transduction protein